MNKLIVAKLLVLGSVVVGGTSVQAGPSDGASVLEREAARARELQDLKYQAKLIEQRAKIAKSYQAFKDSGGVLPGDMDSMGFAEKPRAESVPAISLRNNAETKGKFTLPVLKRVNGNKASFTTTSGSVEAKEGGYLPGGYRVLTVSSADGVKLEKEGVIYQVGFSWE